MPDDVRQSVIAETAQSSGRGIGAKLGQRERMAELERVRLENPYLADLIEDTSDLEKLGIGFTRGLRTAGRGVAKIVGQDVFSDVNDPSLDALQEASQSAQIGQVLGESAPFIAAAPLTGTVGSGLTVARGGAQIVPKITSTIGRAAGTSALSGAEGGIIAAGEDQSASEIAKRSALGGTIGLIAEGAPSVISGIRRKALANSRELLKEPTNKEISKAVREATPTVDQLKTASRDIYNADRKSVV